MSCANSDKLVSFAKVFFYEIPFVVGPGNKFVAEAKRQLFGRCGIDQVHFFFYIPYVCLFVCSSVCLCLSICLSVCLLSKPFPGCGTN